MVKCMVQNLTRSTSQLKHLFLPPRDGILVGEKNLCMSHTTFTTRTLALQLLNPKYFHPDGYNYKTKRYIIMHLSRVNQLDYDGNRNSVESDSYYDLREQWFIHENRITSPATKSHVS